MSSEQARLGQDSVGAWAKKYYFASREVMDSVLRPYNLGSTQWYVLHQLATNGPTPQRDLVIHLGIERATLSGIVATLVRKDLVAQEAGLSDQRQRILSLTASGASLWAELPDPIEVVLAVAFEGASPKDLATTLKVLREATLRLSQLA
jgi:DNA-binding MarR family transcriptional regulator